MSDHPKEPTAEQCSKQERVEDCNGCPAFACWYPQMGGYVGKAVVVLVDKEQDSCFDVYVWHDGEFPFSEDSDDRGPVKYLHHCTPSQFIDFGNAVLKFQEQR